MLAASRSRRPLIIAELGINHGGCLDTAKMLAELAAENGADVIKSQLHIPSEEMSNAARSIIPGHCSSSIYDVIESVSLSVDAEYELKVFIESLGVSYLCTPFSIKAADILVNQFEQKHIKIGNGESNNFLLLYFVCDKVVSLIISTGMVSIKSVQNTVDFVSSKSESLQLFLLHTTNLYPTPNKLVRLGSLRQLQELVGEDFVGLSDHTTSNLACLGAVACGAVILERHFTDTKDREGPDILNSMDPRELRELRRDSEIMHLMRDGNKDNLLQEEDDTRNFAFATLVSTRAITKGSILCKDDLTAKRPGTGDFLACDLEQVLGRKVLNSIMPGSHIFKHDLVDKL